jgi:hypothetical protein
MEMLEAKLAEVLGVVKYGALGHSHRCGALLMFNPDRMWLRISRHLGK